MKKQPNIGRSEMEILQHIADHDPSTVREVADHFAETRGHVRTTVLNVMERLRKKGYLKRRRSEGVYQYSPSVPKTELLGRLVKDFVETSLGGSVSPFVAYLSGETEVTEEELKELKQLVRDLDRDRRERSG